MTTTINASTSSGLVVTPDNSGFVQLQYNGVAGPAFNAALSGYNGGVSVTAFNPIIFNVTQYERGGTNYSTSNGRFTAPISGFYFLAFNLLLDSSQGAGDINIKLYLNGSNNTTYPQTFYSSRISSAYQMLDATFVMNLTAGQYITVVPQSTMIFFGGNGTSDTQTRFMGYLIA
jgi:hypothetical protein